MKLLRKILVILTLGLVALVWPQEVKSKRNPFNENYFSEQLLAHGFSKGVSKGGLFHADLTVGNTVIEVDWAHKVYEGIGQSLVYAHEFGMDPGLVILVDVSKKHNYKKFLSSIEHYGIQLWVAKVDRLTGEVISVEEI